MAGLKDFPNNGALHGLKILDSGSNIAGPFAGGLLAEGRRHCHPLRGPQEARQPARLVRLSPEPPQPALHGRRHQDRRGPRDIPEAHQVGRHLGRVLQGRPVRPPGPERRVYLDHQPQARHLPRLRATARAACPSTSPRRATTPRARPSPAICPSTASTTPSRPTPT